MYVSFRLSYDKRAFGKLYTDTTNVKNVQGQNCLGKNSTDRGRLATKVAILSDDYQFPLSIAYYPGNTPDIKTVPDLLSNVNVPLRNDRRVVLNLIADKAYTCKPTHALRKELGGYGIKLIVEPKKNALNKKFTRCSAELMKTRHSIENYFAITKASNKRCRLRYDRYITSFRAHYVMVPMLKACKYLFG